MEIVTTVKPTELRLSEEFLSPYRGKGDPFDSLLSRSTYLTKYCRGNTETWTDTIRRVVEGNISLAPGVHRDEAQLLFHLFWTGQALPPGRGLWTGGVEGIPADARYNCWATTLYGVDDWCWVANQLMLGGGVGVGLGSLDQMPVVSATPARFGVWCKEDHENLREVKPEGPGYLNGSTPVYVVPDSREGWVQALRLVMTAAYEGKDYVVDVSDVRSRGLPIKTFGGIACGPGPLTNLLRASWDLIRGAAGRRLNSVECLDITNHIGLCIKSGNVRRSALIVLGSANDQDFRDAKKNEAAVISHRHTSNNSLVFRDWGEIANFDWSSLVKDNIKFGEPGLLNLAKIWETDPEVTGINPCFAGDTLVAVADGRNAVAIKQLADEGKDVPVYSMDKATGKVEIKLGRHPRVTGHGKSLVRVWLDDGGYIDTTPDHKFLLRDGTSIEAQALQPGMSLPRFTKALEPVKSGGKDYYLVHGHTRKYQANRVFEHRLVAKFHNPEEWDQVYSRCSQNGFANTGGLVVHHKDYNQLNNAPDNLQIMTFKDHVKLHGEIDQAGEKNGRWSGHTHEELRVHGLQLTRQLDRRFSKKEWMAYAEEHNLPQTFSGYRTTELGSLGVFGKWCAAQLGIDHVDEDPRVVSTYQSMLSQGYNACITQGVVLVGKVCEGCGVGFEVEHTYRERSFCSNACGTLHVNTDSQVKIKRVAGMDRVYSKKAQKTKSEQARLFSELKFKLERDPNRKEWSQFCKAREIPSRIGPTLKHGYRSFDEVVAAGSAYNHKVTRVEPLEGEHTVYNITVDDFHTVAVVTSTPEKRGAVSFSGVITANCGEIPLHDREACNLAEVFPAKFEAKTDPHVVFKIITRYSLRQRLTPLSDPQADAVRVKNMRVGVGLGGICDFAWTPEVLASWYATCRSEADSYANELGVNRPNAVTTTKPSGTISLLNGSSPGVHAPHSEFYVRRTRIAKNDPMSGAMIEAGVPHEEDIYDSTGHTWVFSFPTKAPHARSSKTTETIREQFERQATIQKWWADNAVSATLNFCKDTEREELASCLAEYVPRLKSTSCLPKAHGYKQPPYEEIDAATYKEMHARIKHDHPLVGGDLETMQGLDECINGVCPVR